MPNFNVPRSTAMAVFATFLFGCPLLAFDPPVSTVGPITVKIVSPKEISKIGTPIPFQVELRNAGSTAVNGRLRVWGIDGWKPQPAEQMAFALQPEEVKKFEFTITAPADTLNALYPLHARADFKAGEEELTAHAVMIVAAQNERSGRAREEMAKWEPVELRANAALPLLRTPARRSIVAVFGQAPMVMPPGWQGSEPQTRATIEFNARVTRGGEERSVLAIHPPYHEGRTGSAAVQFPMRLPAGGPVHLRFALAIRDHVPNREPPSDGVTFRVRVIPFAATADLDAGEVVYEQHSAAKTWIPADVDLSRFGGQDVIVQLESHPGPARNTVCDQSYWAEPVLLSGKRADGEALSPAPFPPPAEARPRVLGTMNGPEHPWQVKLWPGRLGLLDAAIGFEHGEQQLLFQGLRVRVNGANLQESGWSATLVEAREEPAEQGCRVRHQFEDERGRCDLLIELSTAPEALRAKVWLEHAPPPQPWQATYLEDVAAGAWSQRAERVYAGTGNVLQDPQAFDLGYDGHRLAASFVGFDFDNGLSLVQAVDAIPNRLEVRPDQRLYTLHTPHAQTLYFIPSTSVWTAVKSWRELSGKSTRSRGMARLAGRFVFDWWGGDYAGSAAALQRSFRYGLTHAVVVWHNWQHFGYDNRLPDIWPPNPKCGTEKQFQALVELCDRHGVLFAPHDNYIDYYPDAEGFSYDHIAFTRSGEPVKAWFNPGPQAQSYRWRADHIGGVAERNLLKIRDAIHPSAYFIDVFTSIEPYDYWTREGQFHDRLSTAKTWGELFDWIRYTLGNNAPQISESGHDALIGYVDGAQCNHLRVGPPEAAGDDRWFLWDIRCRDAERIPWFDAAYHENFALHGAGYENRFRAGLDARRHGMYSDDYISVEVLDGHPAMVGQLFSRDVVRKYWLLNELASKMSFAYLDRFEFIDNDLHRMNLAWARRDISYMFTDGREIWSGPQTQLWVNRGESGWNANGHVLPPYGWYGTCNEGSEAAVEKIQGRTVEWSKAPGRAVYINTRTGPGVGPESRTEREMVKVGPLATGGACRLVWSRPSHEGLVYLDEAEPVPAAQPEGAAAAPTIIPLPNEPPCTVRVHLAELARWRGGSTANYGQLEVLSEEGAVLNRLPLVVTDEQATIQTQAGVFAYRLAP